MEQMFASEEEKARVREAFTKTAEKFPQLGVNDYKALVALSGVKYAEKLALDSPKFENLTDLLREAVEKEQARKNVDPTPT